MSPPHWCSGALVLLCSSASLPHCLAGRADRLDIDEFFHLPHIVRPGETISSTRLTKKAGGKGANQAYALARAGGGVVLDGCIGDDGAWVRGMLEGVGVDVGRLRVVENEVSNECDSRRSYQEFGGLGGLGGLDGLDGLGGLGGREGLALGGSCAPTIDVGAVRRCLRGRRGEKKGGGGEERARGGRWLSVCQVSSTQCRPPRRAVSSEQRAASNEDRRHGQVALCCDPLCNPFDPSHFA